MKRHLIAILLSFVALGTAESQTQPPPPIVRPGPPGESARVISAAEASDLAGTQYIEADVRFVQEMIAHHAQALEMIGTRFSREASVKSRASSRRASSSPSETRAEHDAGVAPRSRPGDTGRRKRGVPDVGHAQRGRDESARERAGDRARSAVPRPHDQESPRSGHDGRTSFSLSRARAQDSQLFDLTSDIAFDRSTEIDRMDVMLRELSTDPRVNLKAGFRDAGEAALNLERVATLPKPDGFYDPSTPAGRPMPPEKKPEKRKERNEPKRRRRRPPGSAKEDEKEDEDKSRPGLLSFANTDLAFSKDVVIEGNYHGFNTYNIEDPMTPAAPRVGGLSRRPGRRLPLREPSLHVGRADARPARLRRSGCRRAEERSALPRDSHLRHQRHADAEAGGGGPDLPRLAHPHAGERPGRQGQHLRLQLRHELGAPEGGARRSARTRTRRRIRTRRSSAST